MTFYVENEHKYEFNFDVEEVLRLVTVGVYRYIAAKNPEISFPEWEVNLYIVNEEEIRAYNRDNRGIDRVTDVLSFPNLNALKPGVFPEEEILISIDPESNDVLFGDIVLCYEKITSQAMEYGHSLLRETAFLICHSLLHLSGYDHETEDQAKEMEALQVDILNALGLTRDVESLKHE